MFERLKVKERRVFLSAQEFLDAAIQYFKWAESTPLLEEEVYMYKGAIIRADKKKVRAFTKQGLSQYLSIPSSRLYDYKSRGGDWEEAVELIEQAIFNQKFEHAAAGMLNSTIIARDLGLAEKNELTGKDGGPIKTEDVTPEALLDEARRLGIAPELLGELGPVQKED